MQINKKIINIDTDAEFNCTVHDPTCNLRMEGYMVELEDGAKLKVGISSFQNCCEHWGYLTTNDDVNYFVEATLLSVSTTDIDLNTQLLTAEDIEVDSCMFVNLETSKGLLQLVLYNEHNAYYGHHVVVVYEDKRNSTTIEEASL